MEAPAVTETAAVGGRFPHCAKAKTGLGFYTSDRERPVAHGSAYNRHEQPHDPPHDEPLLPPPHPHHPPESAPMEPDLFADELPPPAPRKGRGTSANPSSRYLAWTREAIAGNGSEGSEDCKGSAPRSQLLVDSAKTVISRNDSPDLPFDRSLNPYRGCEHGCIYCYARSGHAWLGHSPGLDFETLIYHKPEAAKLLRRELARPGYICQPLAIGTHTDAWQPVERRLRLTRSLLALLAELEHPALLLTKSALIERDLDLIAAMAKKNLVHAAVSLTTLDGELARRLEPRAASPQARLATIARLAEAGVPVRVMISPLIPGLTDHELERLLVAAREAGARAASYGVLRLPRELHALFERWLAWHAPGKAARVMAILYDMRGGSADDSRFATRMHGLGHFADLLAQRFALHCRRLGYGEMPALDCSRFGGTASKDAANRQRGLFDDAV